MIEVLYKYQRRRTATPALSGAIFPTIIARLPIHLWTQNIDKEMPNGLGSSGTKWRAVEKPGSGYLHHVLDPVVSSRFSFPETPKKKIKGSQASWHPVIGIMNRVSWSASVRGPKFSRTTSNRLSFLCVRMWQKHQYCSLRPNSGLDVAS